MRENQNDTNENMHAYTSIRYYSKRDTQGLFTSYNIMCIFITRMGLYDYKNHETTYSALDVVNYSLPAKFLWNKSIHYMSPDPSRASRLKGCGYARLHRWLTAMCHASIPPPLALSHYYHVTKHYYL